jgi:hypothetical protein
VGQEKNHNLYGAVGQRTLLSMNDFTGMSLAYRFSPNSKMSRAEQSSFFYPYGNFVN